MNQHIHVLMEGDGAVGCTALWVANTKHIFFTDYVPTVFEHHEKL